MRSTNYCENDLNVTYISKFFEKSDADDYFTRLYLLPFYEPTSKIWGKSVKVERRIIAYGDPGITYAFSGEESPVEPWTPLMRQLRDHVEKHTGCTYNYVLVNNFADGNHYTPHHKDNDSSLDSTFPIAVLSFGEKRKIQFKRPKCASTYIELEHGSLYTMGEPTNELFTHAIIRERSSKKVHISLSFRHMFCVSATSPLKRRRLQLDEGDTSKNCLPPSTINPLQEDDSANPMLAAWDLNRNTFLHLVMEKDSNLNIHIRNFQKLSSGELMPTKQVIDMTINTWTYFRNRIQKLKFKSLNDSFVCGNELLLACVDGESCLLQKMFPLNENGFFLKPAVLRLFKDQISQIINYRNEISELVIKAKFMKQLPNLILKNLPVCKKHLSESNAKEKYLTTILNEVRFWTDDVLECSSCNDMIDFMYHHACKDTDFSVKFQKNRQTVLLQCNVFNIAKRLSIDCNCHYTSAFFNQFTLEFYENYLEVEMSKTILKSI